MALLVREKADELSLLLVPTTLILLLTMDWLYIEDKLSVEKAQNRKEIKYEL